MINPIKMVMVFLVYPKENDICYLKQLKLMTKKFFSLLCYKEYFDLLR